MFSTLASNLHQKSQPLILTSTRLKENFEKIKKNLEIFKDLAENEKLGKQVNKNGEPEYYKVAEYRGMFVSRWWYGEGRQKTTKYYKKLSKYYGNTTIWARPINHHTIHVLGCKRNTFANKPSNVTKCVKI